jgi:CubicO group peptidase (beta-lactamase class C family)
MNIDPNAAGFDAQRLNRITDHLQKNYIDAQKIVGCQALVSRRGQLAYFKSFGLQDRERNSPMRDDAIFRIYSMTKPITSIALMQLYERGLFQLNDPVHRVIPEWRGLKEYVSGEGDNLQLQPIRKHITFRHLLNHSAGLTYGGGPFFTDNKLHPVDAAYQALGIGRGSGETLQSFVQKLAQVPVRYTPGERWMYSLATDVCAYLVEALSGQRFDRYLQEHILGPLKMADTAHIIDAHKLDRYAANYVRAADKSLKLFDDPLAANYASADTTFFGGGSGLVSTTADYYRFCEMLRRGGELDGVRIIGSRTIGLMARNHLPQGKELAQIAMGAFSETAYEGTGFGLGFASTLDEVASGGFGAGDFYWGGMASTIFWVDRKEDLVAIFMTQLIPSATFNFRGQLKNIIYSSLVD